MSDNYIRPEGSTTRMRWADPQTAAFLCDVCGFTWTRSAGALTGSFLHCPNCEVNIPDTGAPPPTDGERIAMLERQVTEIMGFVLALTKLCNRQTAALEQLADRR
jgi:hypothetical protein